MRQEIHFDKENEFYKLYDTKIKYILKYMEKDRIYTCKKSIKKASIYILAGILIIVSSILTLNNNIISFFVLLL